MGVREEWLIKTVSIRPRSAELARVDAGIQLWITKGPGADSANLKALWNDFLAWKRAQPMEFNRATQAATALESELARVWKPPSASIGAVKSTGTSPQGWTLVDYDPLVHGGSLLPANQRIGTLSGPEIQRINEAFRRARYGAEAARDALVKVKQSGFAASTSTAKQAYLDFFGSYDDARFATVLANLTALALAFGNGPNVIDCRNRTVWWNTYGGCVRANIVSRNTAAPLRATSLANPGLRPVSTQGVTLTGTVDILIGRAFLGGAGYAGTTDATVGTLVHEFAHGTFAAADVPKFTTVADFESHLTSKDHSNFNYGNSTDPFRNQASTEADDKHLAANRPEYAIVNADCYGQFTRAILAANVA